MRCQEHTKSISHRFTNHIELEKNFLQFKWLNAKNSYFLILEREKKDVENSSIENNNNLC